MPRIAYKECNFRADKLAAVTGSGVVPENQVREFRQCCGWQAEIDRKAP